MKRIELRMHRKPARGFVYGMIFSVTFWALTGTAIWSVSYLMGLTASSPVALLR